MDEEKREKPKDLDYCARAYQLLVDWASKRGILDKWKEAAEKLTRKEWPDRMPVEVVMKLPEKISHKKAAEIMSRFLGIPLACKQKLEICGKKKEFDMVNTEHRIVGDLKRFEYKGTSPRALEDNMSTYIWLMEKLAALTGEKWKKILVGWGYHKFFEDYARNYSPWISDVEIYFIDNNDEVHKIR